MKAMKAMKAMKVKRVSKIARGKRARSAVFKGKKEKTSGGMTKASLTKNKNGKIVSKAASARAKKTFATSALKAWNLKGFVPVGGKTAQGKALYAKAKSLLK